MGQQNTPETVKAEIEGLLVRLNRALEFGYSIGLRYTAQINHVFVREGGTDGRNVYRQSVAIGDFAISLDD